MIFIVANFSAFRLVIVLDPTSSIEDMIGWVVDMFGWVVVDMFGWVVVDMIDLAVVDMLD